MFMYSLDGDACEWYFSLPPSSISSLKDFHTLFHKHYKRYFLAEFLFENCCEEYELHNETEDIDREEIVPHNLHQFSNDLQDDVSSHKHELEMDNEEVVDSEFAKENEEEDSLYVISSINSVLHEEKFQNYVMKTDDSIIELKSSLLKTDQVAHALSSFQETHEVKFYKVQIS